MSAKFLSLVNDLSAVGTIGAFETHCNIFAFATCFRCSWSKYAYRNVDRKKFQPKFHFSFGSIHIAEVTENATITIRMYGGDYATLKYTVDESR